MGFETLRALHDVKESEQEMISRDISRQYDERTLSMIQKGDRTETPPSILNKQVQLKMRSNGSTVTIFGLTHTPEFFLSYRAKLEKAIAGSDVVVLEGFPQVQYFERGEFNRSKLLEYASEYKLNSVDKEIVGWVNPEEVALGEFAEFYEEVARITQFYGKKIVTGDPHRGQDIVRNTLTYAISALRQSGREVEHMSKNLASVLTWTVALGGALPIAMSGIHDLASAKTEDVGSVSQASGRMGRRAFLKFAAAGATVAVVHGLGKKVPNLSLKSEFKPGIGFEGGGADSPMNFNDEDFRDVTVSKAIDMYTKSQKTPKKILVVYGYNHARHIKHYLESPRARDNKYKLYFPYKKTDFPQMFEYSNDDKNGWKENYRAMIK